jgi:hypothetical protein
MTMGIEGMLTWYHNFKLIKINELYSYSEKKKMRRRHVLVTLYNPRMDQWDLFVLYPNRNFTLG